MMCFFRKRTKCIPFDQIDYKNTRFKKPSKLPQSMINKKALK